MNALPITVLLLSLCLSPAFADVYQQEVQEALNQLQVSKSILGEFDIQTLPDFDANPKEQHHMPSQQGELEHKGRQYVAENQEGQYLGTLADRNKETMLDKESKDKGRLDLENTLNDNVACQDGSCIATIADESHDFSEGAVQMGALNGVAEDVRDKQVPEGVAAIFKAKNITCRVVYKENRFNHCNKDHWGASESEKELHKAQRERRAIIVYDDTYCSKFKKKYGHRTCTQKSQSWCVFQSRLAYLIQVEARRQLGINFGYVGGRTNNADCRGLSAKEVAAIQFDTPEMQQALNELAQVFASKICLPEQTQVTSRVDEQVKAQQGGVYE